MSVADAVTQLGSSPLTEEAIAQHLRPLFTRTLVRDDIYLANHSLGRPLDASFADVQEGMRLWAEQRRDARKNWSTEQDAYRAALAALLGLTRPDLVVPKLSAGHALRAVLHTLPEGASVVTTDGEFSAVSVVLAQYAALGRLQVLRSPADADGHWTASSVGATLRDAEQAHLVIVSHVFYATGQVFAGLPALAAQCRGLGASLLVDTYHALGALPVNMLELGCDYMIGGCYKYLRGGEGTGFLALSPEKALHMQPAEIGWYAQQPGTDPWAPEGPALRAGGDGWLDGTPAMLTAYQARSGLAFTQALGMERMRAYSLQQLGFLREGLRDRGIESTGGDAGHGAFLTVAHPRAAEAVARLGEEGIICDERFGRVRLCPDVLTTRGDLGRVCTALARL